jgi:hypothetical protein
MLQDVQPGSNTVGDGNQAAVVAVLVIGLDDLLQAGLVYFVVSGL